MLEFLLALVTMAFLFSSFIVAVLWVLLRSALAQNISAPIDGWPIREVVVYETEHKKVAGSLRPPSKYIDC